VQQLYEQSAWFSIEAGCQNDAMANRSSVAAAVVAFAILAACSSPSSETTPVSQPAAVAVASRAQVPAPYFYPISQLTPANVLRMQLEGKFPARQPRGAFVAGYQRSLVAPKIKRVTPGRGKVAIWSATFDSELVGLTANAKKTLITVEPQGCSYLQSVKVDASTDVWTSCEYANDTQGAALQEYSSSGTLLAQYSSACPSNLPSDSCSDGWLSSFFDGATGGNLACGAAEDFEYEPCEQFYVRLGFRLLATRRSVGRIDADPDLVVQPKRKL
jgi:hypothetical protein